MLNLSNILDELGQAIVADAKGDTKVDTGALKESIKYKVNGNRLTLSQLAYGQYQKPNELEVSVDKIINKNLDKITDEIMKQILE